MTSLIDIKAMLDGIEERGRKRLAKALTTAVEEVMPLAPAESEEIGPVVE